MKLCRKLHNTRPKRHKVAQFLVLSPSLSLCLYLYCCPKSKHLTLDHKTLQTKQQQQQEKQQHDSNSDTRVERRVICNHRIESQLPSHECVWNCRFFRIFDTKNVGLSSNCIAFSMAYCLPAPWYMANREGGPGREREVPPRAGVLGAGNLCARNSLLWGYYT